MSNSHIPVDKNAREQWRAELVSTISDHEVRFRRTKALWNRLYYSSLYGAVILSALSALVLKLESFKGAWQVDAAALLATLAAIIGTASAAGNFPRRWRTARLARATMQKLLVDLHDPEADLARVATECKRAIDDYQEGVVGDA